MGKRAKNKSHLEVQNKNPLNEKLIVFSFIFLITIIFFFPAFQGKIECPVDIRDYYCYPWKYHSIDENLIKKDLASISLDKSFHAQGKSDIVELFLNPSQREEILLRLDFEELKNILISKDFNYYLYFEFLQEVEKDQRLDLGVYVTDRRNSIANLPFAVFPLERKGSDSKWLFVKANLNFVLDKLKSFENLKNYDVVLAVVNKNNNKASLFIDNMKIISEDFSRVNPKEVHNFYLEDLIIWFTPAREIFSDSIKKWKIPFWTNSILTGTEFISEPQVGYFNPIYFVSYLMFDHFTAHLVVLILFFLIGGLGSYLLARSWNLSISASLLTSLVYVFNPYLVVWLGYEHTLMCNSITAFLILFYDKALKSENFLNNNLIFSALICGILFLSGHLQVVYYSLLFFVLYAIFKFVIASDNFKEKFIKHFFSISFVVLFGFAIGGIVLLPFFPLLRDSHRMPISEELLRANSIDPCALKGLLYPYYKGKMSWLATDRYSLDPLYIKYKADFFKNYLYFGFLPFILSFFSLKTIIKNKIVIFLYLTIIFSFLNSACPDFYLFIRNVVPGFSLLQNSRIIQLYSYCIPFLVGIGFNNFLNSIFKTSSKAKLYTMIFILLVSTLDLMYSSSFFITWSDKSAYKQIHRSGVLEYLINEKNKSSEPFRVLSVESPFNIASGLKPTSEKPNNLQPYGIEEVSGYSSFLPKDIFYLLSYTILKNKDILYSDKQPYIGKNTNIVYPISEYKSKIYDILNVKYFLTSPDFSLDSDKAIKVFDGDSRLWLNKNYLPRAFLVPSYKIISTKPEIIVTLDNEGFDPLKEVLIQSIDNKTKVILDNLKSKELSLESQIKFAKYENENINLNVKTNSGGILVLGNNLNNEWRVKINNTPADFFKVNLVQTGILLPSEGEYEVEYYFYPKKFYIGLFITGLTLIVLILMLVMLKVKARKE